MFLATNIQEQAPRRAFALEVSDRVAGGTIASLLYIVPTGAEARDLINRVTTLVAGKATIVPNILSLSEFITRLCEQLRPDLELISESQSNAILELVIRELFEKGRLSYFEARGNSAASLPLFAGTFDEIAATIAAMKEQGVTPERLQTLLERLDAEEASSQYRKLRDITLIYSAYQEKLSSKFIDHYGQYLLAEKLLRDPLELAAILKALFPEVTDVIVAPFVRFPEPITSLLRRLIAQQEIGVHIGFDLEPNNTELFQFQIELLDELRSLGAVVIEQRSDTASAIHDHICQTLFNRYRHRSKLDASEHYSLYAAHSMEDEIRFVARSIKQLIREGTTDIARICVASGDQDLYTPGILAIFREYGIPFQLTNRLSLGSSSVYFAIEGLLELGAFGLSRERVRRLLESPYLVFRDSYNWPIDKRVLLRVLARLYFRQGSISWDAEVAEYSSGLREKIAAGFDDEFEERRARLHLEELESVRDGIRVLGSYALGLSHWRTPAEFHTYFRSILSQLGVLPSVLVHSEILLSSGELELETRSYRSAIEVLEDLVMVTSTLGFSSEPLSAAFYLERLRTAATNTRFTLRPEPGSTVVVTSFDQVVGGDYDRVFLLGLREGLFPKTYRRSLFTPSEHTRSQEDHIREQRFLFYQVLTTSLGKTTLTWHRNSPDGSRQYAPSSMIGAVQEILDIPVERFREEAVLSSSEFYRHEAAIGVIDLPEVITRAEEAGMTTPRLNRLRTDMPRMIEAESARRHLYESRYSGIIPIEELSDEEREEIEAYRDRIYSISQLETYANCGFKFFARYVLGLQAEEREVEEGLDRMEEGTMVHAVLFKLLDRFKERGLDIRTMGDEAPAKARELIDELYPQSATAGLHPFERLDRERLFDVRGSGKSIIDRFIAEEQSSGLQDISAQPAYFELAFGAKTPVQQEKYPDSSAAAEVEGIKFRGKIDRIDMDAAHNFVIVDYKTGSSASAADMKAGYSLQLPLYLRIAQDMLKAALGTEAVKGVGALYHQLKFGSEKREFRFVLADAISKQIIEKTKTRTVFESEEQLTDFIDEVIEFAKAYVAGIVSARFPLVSAERRPKVCPTCEYHSICRVEQADADGLLSVLSSHK